VTINKIVMAAMGCLLLSASASALAQGECEAECYPKRWIYFGGNIVNSDIQKSFNDMLPRAKAGGFNGIALDAGGSNPFHFLLDPSKNNAADALKKALETAIKDANDHGLEVIPVGGRPSVPAYFHPELSEAFPTTTPYRVSGGRASPISENLVGDPSFTKVTQSSSSGWAYDVNTVAIANDVGRTDSRSMVLKGNDKNFTRLYTPVSLKKNSAYRLSFYLKPGVFTNPGRMQVLVQDIVNKTGVPLHDWNTAMGWGTTDGAFNTTNNTVLFEKHIKEAPGEWRQYSVYFNSGNHAKAWVYLMIGGADPGAGQVWVDDVEVSEIGIFNPLLRGVNDDYVVTSENGAVTYSPSVDYDVAAGELVIKNPKMTGTLQVKWRQSPEKIMYNAAAIDCGPDSPFQSIQKDLYNKIDLLFSGQRINTGRPKKYFLYYDEIRMLNWEEKLSGCSVPSSAATYLARMVNGIRANLSGVELLTWNDMFDPGMNALPSYFHVNGTLATASLADYGFDKEMVIVNWTIGQSASDIESRTKSLQYFQSHPQMVALYYDDLNSVDTWIAAMAEANARDVTNIQGIMYTTWKPRYEDIGKVAEKLRSAEATKRHWPRLVQPAIQ
jgi:hypothetical protein